MGSLSVKRVAILQGNATIKGLMREALEEETFDVEFLQGSPPGAARAHLVIIDVDSGLENVDRWLRHCDGRQLPVLVCGTELSRDQFAERPWVSRPFTPRQLVNNCQQLLGISTSEVGEQDIPPPIHVGPDMREQPTVEIPTGSDEDLEDDPLFVEIQEKQTARQTTQDLIDVLDLDASSSMILEIEDLPGDESKGGFLVGKGLRRQYADDELTDENPWSNEPDTAVNATSGPKPIPTRSPALSAIDMVRPSGQAEVTTISTWDDVATGDFSSVHRISSLLAEHWDRLGLTARPADRADRLQRVLSAMWRDGMDGLIEELKRIPAVQGFSGRLETLPLVDLFHTIRDRRLRGRLEIGLNGHSFVLYIDCVTLQDVDSLGENTDRLLLKGLLKIGAMDDDTYRHYRSIMGAQDGEPLELRLRKDGIVDDGQLLMAKKERAKKLIRTMCDGRRGTFAFIEIPHGSRQPWPNQGLNLNVDALLLEVLREGSVNPGRTRATSRTDLVIDSGRAASLEPEALTDEERRMLNFFQGGGQSLASARKALSDSDEPVERVVERLKRLELLQKLGQPPAAASDEHGSSPEDPRQLPTRVGSSWDIEVPISDASEDLSELGWPQPEEAGPEEETQQEVGFSAGVPDDFDSWEEDIDELLSGDRKRSGDPPSDDDS